MEISDKQLAKVIEYACIYQKACDYQTAGHHLLEKFETVLDADTAIENLLNELYDPKIIGAKEITIEDVKKLIK